MRRAIADNIRNGVSRMRVGSDVDADDTRRTSGEESPDSHYEEEPEDAEDLEIRPVGVRGGRRGGCGRQHKAASRGGRGSKGPVGEKGGKHPPWSIEVMIKLARAKRDQQAHFEGMPHNYGRMRNMEWKLQDLQKRLVEVGVKRTTDDIGKKWDNLFHQYKKVQRYQNASGGKNFFILTPALRTKEGFDFRMDKRVYLEIDNMSQGNKTIYPSNLADTSARGGMVVDLDLRITDVFVGYPGSCHDIRILQLSSLWARAEEGDLFCGPAVVLPFGVKRHRYILGNNGYPPLEWIIVPYGGTDQYADEERFDNKQKVARGAVEKAFGRLKGMWRLFLCTHQTNMDTFPQQFQVVCILHNILLDAGMDFDENLLWEVDARRRVDLGLDHPPHSIAENFNRSRALALREALAERMKHE
ncbi:hypothetical protein CBR_g54645 [Chara braunii]|uniref:DDE Tnp4 domain-containing protein n=1 Tax=Chara braunii TaxID=69332 RepID=A0A388MCA7_CHABU|nr:hypothetical protein CBR_g54645 [Chara braunii]|eukprot:GBG92200.1 hypothetical protein CBR_g54645 [Chara braunii]